jgi:hypothetical protein
MVVNDQHSRTPALRNRSRSRSSRPWLHVDQRGVHSFSSTQRVAYGYASPQPTQGKLARLRITATGEKRYAKPALGKKRRPAGYGSKVHHVRQRGLAEIYAAEKLPPITTIEAMPPGEREMLHRKSLTEIVENMQKPRHRVRKNGRLLPEV